MKALSIKQCNELSKEIVDDLIISSDETFNFIASKKELKKLIKLAVIKASSKTLEINLI
jgi:hypothetical protein